MPCFSPIGRRIELFILFHGQLFGADKAIFIIQKEHIIEPGCLQIPRADDNPPTLTAVFRLRDHRRSATSIGTLPKTPDRVADPRRRELQVEEPAIRILCSSCLDHLQEMKTQVAALKTKLSAAATAPASSVWKLPHAMYGGGLNAEEATDFRADRIQAGQSAGGFVQDTSDVSPSQFVQNCCAAQVQSLQRSFGSFAQQVPSFNSRFRSLNLILAGLNLASDLLGRTKQMRDSFVALKKAADAPTAIAALQDLSAKLDSTGQAISMGFQNFSVGSAAAGVQGALQNAKPH